MLKRLHRHLCRDATFAEMFAHEARALAALSHPGVAGLAEVRGLDPAREFAQAFAPGLGLDVVHRDVCPANVIASREGRVTLVDFGIATSVWRPERDRGQLRGTRGYMAPEVVTGERDADARADLWAVGVILYELTVGRRLYEGTAPRVMAAIADGPLPSPARDAPGYPDGLDAVARRALARHAEERYASAREMLDALDAAAAAHGVARGPEALAAVIAGCIDAQPRDLTWPG